MASEDEDGPDAALISTRQGEDDKGYIEYLPVDVEPGTPSFDASWEEIDVDVVGIEVDGSIVHVHNEWDYDSEDDDDAPKVVKEWVQVTIGPKPPMIATLGSPVFHGGVLGPGPGSPNVFAEGKPVWRSIVDQHVCPAATPNPHGAGPVVHMGPAPSVYVNGFPVARAGDAVLEAVGGPNPIMFGASSVWAGHPGPPVTTVNPVPRITVEEEPWWKRAGKWIFDIDVEAHAEVDGQLVPVTNRGDVGVSARPFDKQVVVEGEIQSDGELVHGKARAEAKVKGRIFGREWSWDVIDWEKEGGAGKWHGEGSVYVDPVTKKPGVDGNIEFGEEEE